MATESPTVRLLLSWLIGPFTTLKPAGKRYGLFMGEIRCCDDELVLSNTRDVDQR